MKFKSRRTILAAFAAASVLFSANAFADDVADGAALAKANDCFQCHRVPTKLIGPSYKEVATKYKDADDAKITEVALRIINGGSGTWGTTPMRAHPTLVEADAKKMVKWILSMGGDAATTTVPATTPATAPTPATN